ncbi:unnamed protein product [Rhizoctonia solani]|nr:unnamed protein product [Rhizoctonia solani]
MSVGFTVIKKEADDIRSKFEELHESGDEAALNTWKEERTAVVKERQHQAYAINAFFTCRAYSQSVHPPGAFGSYSGDFHYWACPYRPYAEQRQF